MTNLELQTKLKEFPDAANVHADGVWLEPQEIGLDDDGDLDVLIGDDGVEDSDEDEDGDDSDDEEDDE